MPSQRLITRQVILLDGVTIEVTRKRIRNLHLRVQPPAGDVRISAPLRMKLERIHAFAISKLEWIRVQQNNVRQLQRTYLDGEVHRVWGEPHVLVVREDARRAHVELVPGHVILHTKPGSSPDERERALYRWYHEQTSIAAVPMFAKWQTIMRVSPSRIHVRRMKTRWGTCNKKTGVIRLNSELARRSVDCLEYIVVHELAHLIEPSHNWRFVSVMDEFMPRWKYYRRLLREREEPVLPAAR